MAPSIQYNNGLFNGLSNESSNGSPDNSMLTTKTFDSKKADKLVREAFANHIRNIDHETCDPEDENAFFVADLGEVEKSLQLWNEVLPQVTPYYAVKCNSDEKIVELLKDRNVGFDCASKNEIDFVLKHGIGADRIVYANPCKTNSFLRHSEKMNVNLTTVDNCLELYKIKQFHPQCRLLIRIITDDKDAQCQLSQKFGCDLDYAMNEILPLAKDLQLDVRGIAFHMGSGAKDFQAMSTAIRESRIIFDYALQKFDYHFNILDIGGGFERETFKDSSMIVNTSLQEFFPSDYLQENEIKIISEPGRFIVSDAFTLAVHVIGKKPEIDGPSKLYINDGVYGNLNCILFDHQHPEPNVLYHNKHVNYNTSQSITDTDEKGKYQFSIWGPTCDGLDCVTMLCELPVDVQVGDWLYFPHLGAYTSTAATEFNGFSNQSETIYVNSQ